MDDAVELARLLCQGSLEPPAGAALADHGVRAEVERRLGAVGHRLVEIGDQWVALPLTTPADPALELRRSLDDRARQLRSLLYLWLVFAPAEQGRDPAAARGISLDVLVERLEARSWGKGEADTAIAAVCAAGWARRTRDRRLRPAAALVAADERVHEPLAERIIREHLERLAAG